VRVRVSQVFSVAEVSDIRIGGREQGKQGKQGKQGDIVCILVGIYELVNVGERMMVIQRSERIWTASETYQFYHTRTSYTRLLVQTFVSASVRSP
jgi:hypothetical protein